MMGWVAERRRNELALRFRRRSTGTNNGVMRVILLRGLRVAICDRIDWKCGRLTSLLFEARATTILL